MIQLQAEGRRIYFAGETYPVRDGIKALGGKWDADSRRWWVGSTKLSAAEQLVRLSAQAKPKPEDPDQIALTGKGFYKSKSYYLGSTSGDGSRVRLFSLPDRNGRYLDFWADVAEVERTKQYAPRVERIGFRGQTRSRPQTLGSIARFVAHQIEAERSGQLRCPACGKFGPLVHDLEDGIDKCHSCCDMPES